MFFCLGGPDKGYSAPIMENQMETTWIVKWKLGLCSG